MKEYQQYPYRGKEEKWLSWAKKMQSLAQQGLTYTKDKYELDRYQQLRDLSVEVMQDYTGVDKKKIELQDMDALYFLNNFVNNLLLNS